MTTLEMFAIQTRQTCAGVIAEVLDHDRVILATRADHPDEHSALQEADKLIKNGGFKSKRKVKVK